MAGLSLAQPYPGRHPRQAASGPDVGWWPARARPRAPAGWKAPPAGVPGRTGARASLLGRSPGLCWASSTRPAGTDTSSSGSSIRPGGTAVSDWPYIHGPQKRVITVSYERYRWRPMAATTG